MLKFNSYTQKKLERIFTDLEYIIRFEKGNFQAGYCLVENKKIVVINRFFDTEAKINCLVDILLKLEVDEQKLQPKNAEYYRKLKRLAEKQEEVGSNP